MMYRCGQCGKIFTIPKTFEEKHGLDTPPYERIAVCPECEGTDFNVYSITVEKTEVAEKLLPAIAALNRYWTDICDIYGIESTNSDFKEGIFALTELISELFPYISVQIERKILKMRTENEIERIMFYLKGEQ